MSKLHRSLIRKPGAPVLLAAALGTALCAAPASAAPDARPPARAAAAASDTLTLVLVGDVGLNRSGTAVDPGGVLEGGGAPVPWPELSAHVAPLINGDLNFMNLETVVTARNDLAAADKGQAISFGFRSHPNGVRDLTRLGFNLVSAANNHAYDFGEGGVRETVRNLDQLASEGLLHFAGIGLNRDDAGRPVQLTTPAGRVAFSALGIVTNNINLHRATADKPGTVAYRFDDDWRFVTGRLAATTADYRILSVHYGEEKEVRADARQMNDWRAAVDSDGVDLVVGHHAHVVRGIEIRHGAPIFYGLGNFMLRGARDMGSVPSFAGCRDYGLLARVHLRRDGATGRLAMRAIEIVPIHDMHRQPAPFADREEARRRIEVVNVLDAQLGEAGRGAQFTAGADGVGLYCAAGAERDPGRVGELCGGWRAPPPPDAATQRRVMATCVHADKTLVAAKGKSKAKFKSDSKSDSKASARIKASSKDKTKTRRRARG